MSAAETMPGKKLPLMKLAVVALVVLALAAVTLQIVGWKTAWVEGKRLYDSFVDLVAKAGPAWFFGAMAVLPAVGAPMSVFAITGGLVFRATLGFPVTLLLGFTAFLINIVLSYWLARRWLRPALTRWLERSGYHLPQVKPDDMTDFIVLMRVTPGPPFVVQNYLLGLADAPFGRYVAISCGTQGLLITGFMLFGQALNEGQGKLIVIAVLTLATLVVGTHAVRKHLAKKKAA